MELTRRERRTFLASVAGTGAALLAAPGLAAAPPTNQEQEKKEDIPPTEDLMREHGVLRRILLVYQDAVGRLGTDDAAVVGVIGGAAALVRRFVEGYHEKLEEDFVLPTLEKKGKLVELAKVIRVQHATGRKLTESILRTAKPGRSPNADQRRALVTEISAFARMYAAHAAWEDTELFPVYRGLYTDAELDKLGEQFEAQEHKLLGAGGFEGSLREVGELEKALGIHDLAKFTPTLVAAK
jgi:hemerythrin-like domain-containing protein